MGAATDIATLSADAGTRRVVKRQGRTAVASATAVRVLRRRAGV
jgi:hypothetical protein